MSNNTFSKKVIVINETNNDSFYVSIISPFERTLKLKKYDVNLNHTKSHYNYLSDKSSKSQHEMDSIDNYQHKMNLGGELGGGASAALGVGLKLASSIGAKFGFAGGGHLSGSVAGSGQGSASGNGLINGRFGRDYVTSKKSNNKLSDERKDIDLEEKLNENKNESKNLSEKVNTVDNQVNNSSMILPAQTQSRFLVKVNDPNSIVYVTIYQVNPKYGKAKFVIENMTPIWTNIGVEDKYVIIYDCVDGVFATSSSKPCLAHPNKKKNVNHGKNDECYQVLKKLDLEEFYDEFKNLGWCKVSLWNKMSDSDKNRIFKNQSGYKATFEQYLQSKQAFDNKNIKPYLNCKRNSVIRCECKAGQIRIDGDGAFNGDDLYICKDCESDKKYCFECGPFWHRKKQGKFVLGHPFSMSNVWPIKLYQAKMY